MFLSYKEGKGASPAVPLLTVSCACGRWGIVTPKPQRLLCCVFMNLTNTGVP